MHCRLEAVPKLLPFVGSPEYLGNVNIGSFACILGTAITIFKESKSHYCTSRGVKKSSLLLPEFLVHLILKSAQGQCQFSQ